MIPAGSHLGIREISVKNVFEDLPGIKIAVPQPGRSEQDGLGGN